MAELILPLQQIYKIKVKFKIKKYGRNNESKRVTVCCE